MIPATIITTLAAHHLSAREALLSQLREAGATSAAKPAPLTIEGEDAERALRELLEAGVVREAGRGLFYIDESNRPKRQAGLGLKLFLILLVTVSLVASLSTIVLSLG